MTLTIIVPAYNEEKRIGSMLQEYCSYFSKIKGTQIFVVLNGCRDNTLDVVKKSAKKYKFVKYIDIKEAIGKGGALIEGLKRTKGEFVGYADADGATSPEEFYKLISYLKEYDGAIASRWMPGAVVEPKQPLKRRIASRAFNMLVGILFRLHYYDTQCGCKLFRRTAINSVITSLSTTRWAFDLDLLYQLKRKNCSVIEVPTVWKDKSGSVLDTMNVKKVSMEMFLAIVRLRLTYSPFKFIVTIYNKLADVFKN
jgi:glycosyltransferase involved in cell wall biosynthesis